MEVADRSRINEKLDVLSRLINMEKLWPKLVEHEIFDDNYPECSKWQNNWNNEGIIKHILSEIQTRGPHAFQNLLRSLNETDQDDCAQILARINLTYDPLKAIKPLKIKVKQSTEFNETLNDRFLDDPYPMKSELRGIVLILSSYNINGSEIHRECAKYDENNLVDLFEQMGFKVTVENKLDIKGIMQKVKEFSKNPQLRQADCAFLIMIGTNVQDTNYVSMGLENTNLEESYLPNKNIVYGKLVHYFNGQNCPNLVGKPKIFMFHVGSSIHVQNIFTQVEEDSDVESEFSSRNISRHDREKIPRNYADMLITFSTIPDNIREITKNGSLFIQVFCEVFMKYAHNTAVDNLLKMAHERVKSLRSDIEKVPVFLQNLGFRECFLNPGKFS